MIRYRFQPTVRYRAGLSGTAPSGSIFRPEGNRYGMHQVEMLEVTCWCENSYVFVPAPDVLQGRTRACRRRKCLTMAEAAA